MAMLSQFLLLLLLNAVWPISSYASVSGASFQPSDVYLTVADKDKISQLGSHPDDVSLYFNIVLEARLRNVDSRYAHHVRDASRSGVIFYPSHNVMGGQSAGSRILISMPRNLENSFFYYFIKIHELEHTLEHYQRFFSSDPIDDKTLKDPDYIFEREKAAMSAEWFFIHHAPAAMLVGGIRQILQYKKNQFNAPLFVSGQFSSYDLQDYLEEQWEQGRYSRGDIGGDIVSQSMSLSHQSDASGLKFLCEDLLSGDATPVSL